MASEVLPAYAVPRVGSRPLPGIVRAGLLAATGAVVVLLALVVLGDQPGLVKVPLTLAGIGLGVRGVGVAGRTLRGPSFDAGLWLSVTWLTLLIAAAILADVLPLGNHNDQTQTIGIAGNLRPDLFSAHPLGTNNFALDLLARSIYAARVSLLTALLAVTISLVLGGLIGLLAGYYRGWVETVVNVFTDSWLAFPPVVVLLAAAAILGVPRSPVQAVFKVGVVLALVGISTMIRVARANTLTFASREFVTASRALGATDRRILLRELAPNVALPLLSYAFTLLAVFIVAEGALAYLGLGLQQPQPTWGNMIAEGTITDIRDAPHVPLVPGIVMFLTVYSFSRVGDRLRKGWDTKDMQV